MLNIQRIALERALNTLNALGATYRVIIGDESFGTLEVVVPKERKRIPSILPLGTLANYIRPILDNAKVGEVVVVDVKDFEIERLRSAVTAWSCKRWGNGSVMSSVNRADNVIEVLRIA
jgi:hypothetical protein